MVVKVEILKLYWNSSNLLCSRSIFVTMTPYCKMLVLLLDQILSWIQFHYPIYHGVLRYWSSDNVKPGYYVSLRGGGVSINSVHHQLPTGINWWRFIKLTLLVNSWCKDILFNSWTEISWRKVKVIIRSLRVGSNEPWLLPYIGWYQFYTARHISRQPAHLAILPCDAM